MQRPRRRYCADGLGSGSEEVKQRADRTIDPRFGDDTPSEIPFFIT